jgi:hypothetical protein
MPHPDDYNHFAAECLHLIDNTELSRSQRKLLIEMAIAWANVAENASGTEAPTSERPALKLH